MRRVMTWLVATTALLAAGTTGAQAQTLGTFRWQLQPFCNVLTLTVTQVGGTYRLEGLDDRCGGGAAPSSAMGIGYAKPDGSIGFGLTIVLDPGAAPLHLTSAIALSTISGTWQDSAGNAGAFVFNPAIAPGSPRPAPRAVFSAGLSAGGATVNNVASPSAATDAANKGYVDTAVAAAPRTGYVTVIFGAVSDTNIPGVVVQRASGYPAGLWCLSVPSSYAARGAVGSIQQYVLANGVAGILVVSSAINTACLQQGFSLGVYTYSTGGTLTDFPFTLVVPR
jgi:hypothetical protein